MANVATTFFDSVKMIAAEKGIPEEDVFAAVEEALAKAADKFFNAQDFYGNFQAQIVLAQPTDTSGYATLGHHLITFGEFVDHFLLLFGFAHLRANHQEPQHNEHEHNGQHTHQATHRIRCCTTRLGVRI